MPFGCKVIVQIPRESSLFTDGSHGDRALEGIYVGADDSTSSIHVHLFKTNKTELFSDWKAFPDDFPFRDPDVLFDKSIFSAKDARRMHQIDDARLKKRISLQPTRDRTNKPLRHQKHFQLLPAKSVQHQPPQTRQSRNLLPCTRLYTQKVKTCPSTTLLRLCLSWSCAKH